MRPKMEVVHFNQRQLAARWDISEATESCHAPTRVKMCDGMCSACGAEGAIDA